MNAAARTPVRRQAAVFAGTQLAGWIALGFAAVAYTQSRHVPRAIAVPLALAFLTEFSFYLLLGFSGIRAYLVGRFERSQLAAAIAMSALLPFAIFAAAERGVSPFAASAWAALAWAALAWAAIAVAVGGWFLVPVRSPWLAGARDVAFLVFMAAVILSGVLRWIFPAPQPKLPMEVLGHVTLVRSGILAILLLRGGDATGIGFVPGGRDLGIGALWFGVCALTATPLGLALGQLHRTTRTPSLWPSLGLLLGTFWVLAFSEEFFFRGLLQQWLARWTRSRAAGLWIGALLFAACHLGFRGHFPNWRVASLSFVLGLCCGAAFLQARSIRASMVTHALAVGAWRLLLS